MGFQHKFWDLMPTLQSKLILHSGEIRNKGLKQMHPDDFHLVYSLNTCWIIQCCNQIANWLFSMEWQLAFWIVFYLLLCAVSEVFHWKMYVLAIACTRAKMSPVPWREKRNIWYKNTKMSSVFFTFLCYHVHAQINSECTSQIAMKQ